MHLDFTIHQHRELVVGRRKPWRIALGTQGLDYILKILANHDFFVGPSVRGDLEEIGECILLGTAGDDLDTTLLETLERAELRWIHALHLAARSHEGGSMSCRECGGIVVARGRIRQWNTVRDPQTARYWDAN